MVIKMVYNIEVENFQRQKKLFQKKRGSFLPRKDI